MKNIVILSILCSISSIAIGQADSTKTKIKIDGGIRFESLPYGPLPSRTIGPNPVVIGVINASYGKKFSASYWESVDPFGKTGGDYHGLFTSFNQPVGKNATVSIKNAHFFDYSFSKKFTSIFGVKVAVGKKVNFSVNPNYQIFHGRKPRYILIEAVDYKSFRLSGWQINELGSYTTVAGIKWSSKVVKMSKHVSYSCDALWNHRLSGKFVDPNTVCFGLNVHLK